jgi:hypothetical protein
LLISKDWSRAKCFQSKADEFLVKKLEDKKEEIWNFSFSIQTKKITRCGLSVLLFLLQNFGSSAPTENNNFTNQLRKRRVLRHALLRTW